MLRAEVQKIRYLKCLMPPHPYANLAFASFKADLEVEISLGTARAKAQSDEMPSFNAIHD